MWKELAKFLLGVVPPSHGGPQSVMSWRYRMAMCQIASSVSQILQWLVLAAAFGIVGRIGFASQADTQDVRESVMQIQIGQLEGRLFETRVRQCQAIREANSAAKSFLGQKISELQRDYRKLTGHEYGLPGCDAL